VSFEVEKAEISKGKGKGKGEKRERQAVRITKLLYSYFIILKVGHSEDCTRKLADGRKSADSC